MATKKIGSAGGPSRDYSTFDLWASYIDGLNTLAAPEVGEFYNDSEFVKTTSGDSFVLTGYSADATNRLTLTTGAGQSFLDDASKATNPLRYDASKGVGFRVTGGYAYALSVSGTHTYVEKLQFCQAGANYGVLTQPVIGGGADKCILECRGTYNGPAVVVATAGSLTSSAVILTSTQVSAVQFNSGGTAVNVTAVRTSNNSASGKAFTNQFSGAMIVKNCAGFNFTDFYSPGHAGTVATLTNCASDVADTDANGSGGSSGNLDALTYSSQFEDVTSTKDFRLKAGSSLIDAGVTDSTNAPNDIIGTARPSGSAYDIGAWEFVGGGGGGSVFTPYFRQFVAGMAGTP